MAKDINKAKKAKKTNKNQPVSTKSVGISTKSYKPSRSKSAVAQESTGAVAQASYSRASKIAVIAVSAAVLICAVWMIIYFVIDAYQKNFSYLEYNMGDYIELSEADYKNYTLKLDIAKPHTKAEDGSGVSDVQIKVMYTLAAKILEENKTIGGRTTSATEIALGDNVYIWYRAYVIKDGKEVDITSLSNYYKETEGIVADASAMTVGKGSFTLAGLDAGLLGVNTGDYSRYEKIKSGQVKAGQVVYISCERAPVGGTDADKQIGDCVRIDLTDEDTAAIWSDILVGKTIGAEDAMEDFTVNVDGADYVYSKTQILFATECEGDGKLTIETYAPYDHTITQIRNEKVYVDVFVEAVQKRNPWHTANAENPDAQYDLSYDWNDAVIEKMLEEDKLDITEEALLEYEGESLVEKYENYTYQNLLATYKENLKQLTEDMMWDYYLSKVKIKQYPKVKVDDIYREYYDDLEYKYTQNGGLIYNEYTGSNVSCTTLDEYAIIYYGLQYAENKDWQAYIRSYAESLVVERLILFYIMKRENLEPSSEEFNKRYVEIRQEYVDEYIRQDSTDTSEYDEDKYAAYVKQCEDRIFSYFSEDYFKETTYYELVVEELLKYPTVKTLDDIPMSERLK